MLEADIQSIIATAITEVAATDSLIQLNELKAVYLGKNGHLTAYMQQLNALPKAEKPRMGQLINQAKQRLMQSLQEKMQAIKLAEVNAKLAAEQIDVTLPGRGEQVGSLHPIAQTRARIEQIFTRLGFALVAGPEIEDDYHNFTALNIPPYHPARAMQDTFYLEQDQGLLRTHMSPVQIRTMQQAKPPIKIVAPGRVYRCDFDLTHTPMFHQVEGLYVDEQVSFAQLKYVMQQFLAQFFNTEVTLRYRSSYFPFTEPSAELDIQCVQCGGKGCRVCSHTGWLEVVGCGMVHPNVLRHVNIDPAQYSGFAFGFGYDRLTMLYYGIDDLRSFFTNDLRFLSQF